MYGLQAALKDCPSHALWKSWAFFKCTIRTWQTNKMLLSQAEEHLSLAGVEEELYCANDRGYVEMSPALLMAASRHIESYVQVIPLNTLEWTVTGKGLNCKLSKN